MRDPDRAASAAPSRRGQGLAHRGQAASEARALRRRRGTAPRAGRTRPWLRGRPARAIKGPRVPPSRVRSTCSSDRQTRFERRFRPVAERSIFIEERRARTNAAPQVAEKAASLRALAQGRGAGGPRPRPVGATNGSWSALAIGRTVTGDPVEGCLGDATASDRGDGASPSVAPSRPSHHPTKGLSALAGRPNGRIDSHGGRLAFSLRQRLGQARPRRDVGGWIPPGRGSIQRVALASRTRDPTFRKRRTG